MVKSLGFFMSLRSVAKTSKCLGCSMKGCCGVYDLHDLRDCGASSTLAHPKLRYSDVLKTSPDPKTEKPYRMTTWVIPKIDLTYPSKILYYDPGLLDGSKSPSTVCYSKAFTCLPLVGKDGHRNDCITGDLTA